MKLQNNQTGQVENFCIDKDQICSCDRAFVYDSLTQLQEAGWKDYEEPPLFWYIDDYDTMCGTVGEKQNLERSIYTEQQVEKLKAIGNYFGTEEEAEKAVEKLKALKRLEENGFKFTGWKRDERYIGDFTITATDQTSCDDKDLDLLFNEKEYLRKEVQKIIEKNADYYGQFRGEE